MPFTKATVILGIVLVCGFACLCRADTPPIAGAASSGAAPTAEEQARQIQQQILVQLRSRLDTADALLGSGHNKEALSAYRVVLEMEPNFAALAAQKTDLTAQADTLQEQIFDAQKQGMSASGLASDSLVTQKIALAGRLQAVQELLDLQPSFAEAHANLARLLLQNGAASESLLQYQQAVRLSPALEATLRPALLHAHLAEADRLAKLGRPEALAEYREAIRLDPGNSSAHSGLGHALLGQGKAAEAAAELTQAVQLNPGDTEAALTLGLALYQNGQRAEARQQWRRFLGNPDPGSVEEARSLLARYLLEPAPAGAAPNAAPETESAEVQRCREEVRNFPDEAFSHSNLALALFHAKQAQEALQEVQTALRLDPDSVEAHTNLGLILSGSEQDDAAAAQYRQALKLDSENGAVHNDLGVVYFNRQQWKQAEYEFRKALQGDHSDPYAHHNLADTLLQEGRLAESIRECDKTLQYDPAFSAAYGTRGLVEDNMGASAKGLSDLQKAVHAAADPLQALLDLADPLRQFAGRDLAAQQFKQIMRQYPEAAESEEALGRLLLAAGEDPEATAAFQTAVGLKPDRLSGHLLLARSLLRLNRLDDAAQEARAALRLEPNSAEARNILGLALYQAGQTDEGRKQWGAALHLDDKDAARNAAGFLQEFP